MINCHLGDQNLVSLVIGGVRNVIKSNGSSVSKQVSKFRWACPSHQTAVHVVERRLCLWLLHSCIITENTSTIRCPAVMVWLFFWLRKKLLVMVVNVGKDCGAIPFSTWGELCGCEQKLTISCVANHHPILTESVLSLMFNLYSLYWQVPAIVAVHSPRNTRLE